MIAASPSGLQPDFARGGADEQQDADGPGCVPCPGTFCPSLQDGRQRNNEVPCDGGGAAARQIWAWQ